MASTTHYTNTEFKITHTKEVQLHRKKLIDRYQFFRQDFTKQYPQFSFTSINTIQPQQQVAIIGCVFSISQTTNKHTLMTIEDPSGRVDVLIHNSKKTLQEKSKTVPLDVCILIVGKVGDGIIFAEELYYPVEQQKQIEYPKFAEESYILFTSDTEYGSTGFYEKEFKNYIKWIQGSTHLKWEQSSQKILDTIQKKTSHFIITGDIVAGTGVFPNQQKELQEKNIYNQYEGITQKYLSKIPSNISTILIPGNHDATHIAEPQPPLQNTFTNSLSTLKNVTLLSNPSFLEIQEGSDSKKKLTIQLYHGVGIHQYEELFTLDPIKNSLHQMISFQHFAPVWGKTPQQPTPKDYHIIRKIPHIFATGHTHKKSISYHPTTNTLCINAGCWVKQTVYQKNNNIIPDPCIVYAYNTKTHTVYEIDFLQKNVRKITPTT